jgi:hypothetical protein
MTTTPKPKVLQEAFVSLENLIKRLSDNNKVVQSSDYEEYVERLSHNIRLTMRDLDNNQAAFHRIILADEP